MGSEMCIRDRTLTILISTGIVLLIVNTSFSLYLTQILAFIVAVSCLLYTSDAADERSSVDLGGRRIIKKKNHLLT